MVRKKVVRKPRQHYRLTLSFCVVVFLVGANIGLLAFISKPNKVITPISLAELLDLASAFNVTSESSTATFLEHLVTLHCAVVRDKSDNVTLKDEKEVRVTWAQRCNSFSVNENGSSMALWPTAILDTFENYGETADWFLFVSTNTFVIPENARLFLLPFLKDKSKALVFGSETDYGALPCFLLSRGALRRLKFGLKRAPSCALGSNITPDPLLECLSELGIPVWETRDHLRRHRILPIPPSALQDPSSAVVSNYSLDSLLHPIVPGPQCCAPTAFAILLLNHNFYRMFYYFINIVHTKGTETDYRVLSIEDKLSSAWYEATKGIPPTFLIERNHAN